jgi:hypothetical protein
MRQVLKGVVKEEVEYLRPADKFGYVQHIDIFNRVATVILDGDDTPITAKYPINYRPVSPSDAPDPVDNNGNANRVRISGKPGSYWITQIIDGSVTYQDPRFINPEVLGGAFYTNPTKRWFAFQAGQPSTAGSTWKFCKLSNTNSFGQNMTGHLRISLRHIFFTSENKVYEVPLANGATAAGTWVKLIPVYSTGAYNGHNFGVEMMTDYPFVSFRVRALTIGGGYAPGGYEVNIEADGDAWDIVEFGDPTEAVTTEPTVVLGDSVADWQPGFISSPMDLPRRSQLLLSGGGDVDYDGSNLFFNNRFIIMGAGVNYYNPSGYINVGPFSGGVSVPVYSKTGVSSVTTSAGGIPFGTWDTLYYEPPYGNPTDNATHDSRFRIVNYTAGYFEVPSHWLMIARCNPGDYFAAVVILADGRIIGQKIAPAYGTNVVDYGTPFPCGYRFIGERIWLEGLIKATGAISAGATLFSMPIGQRPGQQILCTVMTTAGVARLDLTPTGPAYLSGLALATNQWVSLDNISFLPLL